MHSVALKQSVWGQGCIHTVFSLLLCVHLLILLIVSCNMRVSSLQWVYTSTVYSGQSDWTWKLSSWQCLGVSSNDVTVCTYVRAIVLSISVLVHASETLPEQQRKHNKSIDYHRVLLASLPREISKHWVDFSVVAVVQSTACPSLPRRWHSGGPYNVSQGPLTIMYLCICWCT